MSIAGYIVLGIVILFVLLFYILFVVAYLASSKGYREAKRTDATILEDIGDMKLSTGSHVIGCPRFRTFHIYKVSYYVNGEEQVEEAELRNRKLKVGETVEVRYNISKKGKIKLESEAFLCWTREMAIGYTLGIILGITLCVLKGKGMIQ